MAARLRLTEFQLNVLVLLSSGDTYKSVSMKTNRTSHSLHSAIAQAKKVNRCRTTMQLIAKFAGHHGSKIVTLRNCDEFYRE